MSALLEDLKRRLAAAEARAEQAERDAQRVMQRMTDMENELTRLRADVAEIAASGVEFEDERVSYVTVQIERGLWLELRQAKS